jgi:ParB family transcriptional regulator, chromosome partitioning protein
MNMPPRQVHRLGLDLIDVGNRLRPVDPDYVALIAESMAERGQDTPIVVTAAGGPDGNHQLIAGAHRLAAARALGWAEIDVLYSDAEELQAQLQEIDENLIRRELSALDRAVFLARRKEIYEALNPETKHGGKREKGKSQSFATWSGRFTKATADKLGLSERSIQLAVRRASLPAEIREAIATHPISDSGSELDKLIAAPLDRQRAVVAALTRAEKPARNVSAALAEVAGPSTTSRAAETQRQLAALLGAWRKANNAARGQFLDYLASEKAIPERPAKTPTKPKGSKA